MEKYFGVALFLIVLVMQQSCNDKSTQPIAGFSGITETNSTGPEPVGKIDPDDWKPMMNCPPTNYDIGFDLNFSVSKDTIVAIAPNCVKILPAYPNPAKKNFSIQFSINTQSAVVLTLNRTPTEIVKTLVNRNLMAGTYQVFVDGSDLKSAIYRVYIGVSQNGNLLSSYGDVQLID